MNFVTDMFLSNDVWKFKFKNQGCCCPECFELDAYCTYCRVCLCAEGVFFLLGAALGAVDLCLICVFKSASNFQDDCLAIVIIWVCLGVIANTFFDELDCFRCVHCMGNWFATGDFSVVINISDL